MQIYDWGGRKGGTNTAIPHVVAREYRNTAHGRERKPQYRVKIYPNTEIETNGEKLPFWRLTVPPFK